MKVVFMGTPAAAVPCLERILSDGHSVLAVYTQPDRPSGRGNRISFSPVKEFAAAHDFSVLQPTKIRTDEAAEQFRSFGADAAVVVAYGRILPDSFLKAFPYGAINVHFSLLPKYRGAAPVNWAIVNGERETGVTTMKMDAGLDTGDILLMKSTEIQPGENAIDLMTRLSAIGAEVLSETLKNLSEITPVKQDHEKATFAPILKKEDGLIDWTNGAPEIANRIRGFQPFPGSYSVLQGKKITFWSASPIEIPSESLNVPGTVVDARGDVLLIKCGNSTTLSVSELQLEGKRRMNVRDFINGTHLKVGEILG